MLSVVMYFFPDCFHLDPRPLSDVNFQVGGKQLGNPCIISINESGAIFIYSCSWTIKTMDNLQVRLYFDLRKNKKSITTARKSTVKLGKLQSLVGKCCKIRKI